MAKYHVFAHNDKNFVKVGDKVVQYVTPIGSIGTANGQYYAHLHFSISEGLSVQEILAYISGWSTEKVQKYYKDPRGAVNFEEMFGKKVDVGHFGYDWLQWVGYGYHPGVDINGFSGGNSDIGMVFRSSCNGIVIHSNNTLLKNGGWGKIVIVEEVEDKKEEIKIETMKVGKQLNEIAKKYGYDFGENITKDDEAKKLEEFVVDVYEELELEEQMNVAVAGKYAALEGEYLGLETQSETDKAALNEEISTLKTQLAEAKKEKVVELSGATLGELVSAVFNKFKKL